MNKSELMVLMKALGLCKEKLVERYELQGNADVNLYDYKGEYIGTSELVTLGYQEDTHEPFSVLLQGTELNKGKTKKDIKLLQVMPFEDTFLDNKEYRVLSTSLPTPEGEEGIKGLVVEVYNKVLEGN